MNYIKLNLGGRERGAKLGLGFLTKIQEVLNMNLDEINQEISKDIFKMTPTIIYQSLIFNCERAKETPDFDFYDVCDWISGEAFSSENGVVKTFYKAYFDSISVLLPEAGIGEGKKTLPKKVSTPTSGSKK